MPPPRGPRGPRRLAPSGRPRRPSPATRGVLRPARVDVTASARTGGPDEDPDRSPDGAAVGDRRTGAAPRAFRDAGSAAVRAASCGHGLVGRREDGGATRPHPPRRPAPRVRPGGRSPRGETPAALPFRPPAQVRGPGSKPPLARGAGSHERRVLVDDDELWLVTGGGVPRMRHPLVRVPDAADHPEPERAVLDAVGADHRLDQA